jgi:hypothetical protein
LIQATRPLAAATLLAAGCSTLAPWAALPARIEFFRADPASCGQSGSSPICEARVNHVEGKAVQTLSSYAEVAPGPHVLGLFCRMNPGTTIGDAQSHQREVEVDLAAGARYRVEARMQPRPCTMTLIDDATGQAVGKVR